MGITRIFFATDIHGSEKCFLKFLNCWKYYKANVVILGGDITGKMLVPIVERTNGFYTADYLGFHEEARDERALASLKKRIRDYGFYDYVTHATEVQALRTDESRRSELFLRLMQERVEQWVSMADARLENAQATYYVCPGNDDDFSIDSIISRSKRLVNAEGRLVEIDENHEMVSTGYCNLTPWHCPRDVDDADLYGKLEELVLKMRNLEGSVLNFHAPPYESGLDTAPKLSENLTPVLAPGGKPMEIPVGSKAVRDIISRYQPLLSLHGHIHESRGFSKMGRTLCLNPGSEYGDGVLKGVLVDFDSKGIKSYLFTEG